MTTTTSKKKRLKEKGAQMVFETGLLRLTQKVHKNYLTVLNYHRINYPEGDTFNPNVRPTLQAFAE